jgi:hypothetical protein
VDQLRAEWEIEFFADGHGREPVREWMEDLSKQKRMALEEAISVVLAGQGLAVVGTEYGKALGQGLYEFRLRWTAAEVRSKAGRVSDDAAVKSEKSLARVLLHRRAEDHPAAERLRQGPR